MPNRNAHPIAPNWAAFAGTLPPSLSADEREQIHRAFSSGALAAAIMAHGQHPDESTPAGHIAARIIAESLEQLTKTERV